MSSVPILCPCVAHEKKQTTHLHTPHKNQPQQQQQLKNSPPGTSTTSSAMRMYSALARMSSGVAITTNDTARSSCRGSPSLLLWGVEGLGGWVGLIDAGCWCMYVRLFRKQQQSTTLKKGKGDRCSPTRKRANACNTRTRDSASHGRSHAPGTSRRPSGGWSG